MFQSTSIFINYLYTYNYVSRSGNVECDYNYNFRFYLWQEIFVHTLYSLLFLLSAIQIVHSTPPPYYLINVCIIALLCMYV